MAFTEPIPNQEESAVSQPPTPESEQEVKVDSETQESVSQLPTPESEQEVKVGSETQDDGSQLPASESEQEVKVDTEAQESVSQLPAPESEQEVKVDTEAPEDEEEDSGAIFQAVGIITGEINLNNEGKNTIKLGNIEYPLFYIPKKRRVFDALLKEIESTGNHTQRLVVYPRAIHFPKKEVPHQIAFQLVGFDRGREEQGVSEELGDLEFKISGLWQFIPVCRTPCVSVFRNFSRERLEFIKQAEAVKKVKFMKASHLPLLWKDAPVKPFRFNPKAGKDQGHPAFVSVKAKFLPQRNVFGFEALLSLPQENAPRFLKASKKDKAAVQQTAKKGPEGKTKKPEGKKVSQTPTPPVVKKGKPEKRKNQQPKNSEN
ncbi:MAG: hypothetical protein QNJ47_19925 [Nostocaceae cyanobacterium]|nr:hypothetical protein [Nostocaceae cyanobacterium]